MRSIRMKGARGWTAGLAVTTGLLASGCADEAAERPRPVSGEATTQAAASESTSVTTTTSQASDDPGTSTTSAPAGDEGRELGEGDPLRTEIETAYRNAVQAFLDSAAIPDPNHPSLSQWTTGAMFEGWTNDLTAMRIQGRVARDPQNSRRVLEVESVVQRSPDEALIETCNVDDGIVMEIVSGAVINDDVAQRRLRARMVQSGGSWKLSDREDLGPDAGRACFG